MEPEKTNTESLPSQIITPGDLNRLIRELENLDEFLKQAAIRSPQEALHLPTTSRVLEDLAGANSLQLLKNEDRITFKNLLEKVKDEAPTIHLSFAATPSPAFLNKLVSWFRSNIQPNILLKIGLEPSIAGGCIVRTTNKQFDLSFRKHFATKHELLVKKITGLSETVVNE